jgi:hypothetical protein
VEDCWLQLLPPATGRPISMNHQQYHRYQHACSMDRPAHIVSLTWARLGQAGGAAVAPTLEVIARVPPAAVAGGGFSASRRHLLYQVGCRECRVGHAGCLQAQRGSDRLRDPRVPERCQAASVHQVEQPGGGTYTAQLSCRHYKRLRQLA